MAIIIDGKQVSKIIKEEVKSGVSNFKEKTGRFPGLAVILVGNDPASAIYVKNKRKASEEVGIYSFTEYLPEDTSEEKILSIVKDFNDNENIDGILVQLPLPRHIDPVKVIECISPLKDVDGFHPVNAGKLSMGEPYLVPCTPAGIIALLDYYNIEISGKDCVVVGRSNIVGKPVSFLLLKRNGTVTICHTKTKNLSEKIKNADILIAAAGKSEIIKGDWIKEGSTVIDVGVNRMSDGSLRGDVEFEVAKQRAGAISPVPGGVGPMTIALLLKNTLIAATKRLKIDIN